MVDSSTLFDVCDELAVFPLPRVVLMPGGLLPLHVYEPRYTSLVAHCLSGDGVMGIATLKPGFETHYYGAPPVYREVGLGRIVTHEPFEDGRCNIVLQYVGRAVVTEELACRHRFRVFRGELVEDDPTGLREAAKRLRVLILQLGSLSEDASREARRLAGLPPVQMVDALARKLLDSPQERIQYLACSRVADRIRIVQERLASFLIVQGTAEA
jgi:uncharacterized protein